MAICNLFRQLSKETGNFLMFDQYSDDLTRCFVQHDSYDIIPSKFVALDINYGNLPLNVRQSTDMNEIIPTFFQNFFENGCAWLKSTSIKDGNNTKWDVAKWSPEVNNNLFWNSMIYHNLLHINKYDKYWTGTHQSGELESFDVIDEIRYIGNIDVHSYEEKDGIGYSEIYCYIPNNAARTLYKAVDLIPQQTRPDAVSYPDDEQHQYCIGCSAETENILGVLPVGIHTGDYKVSPTYYYGRKYKFYGNEEESDNYPYTDEANMRDYNKYRELSGESAENFFKFNTIVVLYDINIRDKQGNITTLYHDVPMGIYLTGKWDNEGKKITNEVIKYSVCEDAYKSGTSYGLRICTRYMCTPNATTISSVEIDPAEQYAGFSMAMDEMSKSQQKMNEMLEDAYSRTQDMKEAIMSFKNSKTNCPYIRKLGDNHYWFINGRNTGVYANGNPGKDGRNGTILELVELNGTYYWALDGIITNVRAEGIDGLPGLKGDKGDKGDAGHTPTITIKQTKDSSKVGEYLTWFIDGVDTGVLAKANNGEDGEDGKDGLTPTIVQARDGNKYWYIGNVTTGVRAEGKDGQSIFVLTQVAESRDIYIANSKIILHNRTTDNWKSGDTILYTGQKTQTGYQLNPYDLFKIIGYNYAYGAWEVQFLGNVAGSVEGGVDVFNIETIGNTTRVSIGNDNNVKTFDIKEKNKRVSHSTEQCKYNHLHDTIYCCGRPKSKGSSLLEIPYNVHYIKVNDGLWDVAISVDNKYSGLSGYVMCKPTDIFIKDKKFKAEDLYIKQGEDYIKYEGSLDDIKGSMIKRMYAVFDDQFKLAYLKFHNSSRRLDNFNYNTIIQPLTHSHGIATSSVKLDILDIPTQYVIYKGLTQEEKQALAYSYKISKHIGKVHAYIDLYEVFSKSDILDHSFIDNDACLLNKDYVLSAPCDIKSSGILSYSKLHDQWECVHTSNPVKVSKFNKTVQDFVHINENPNPGDIKDIFDLLSVYGPDDILIYKKNNKIRSRFGLVKNTLGSKYTWTQNKKKHHGLKNHITEYKWIKHSPLSKISRYRNSMWQWFAMNEFAHLALLQPSNTRVGDIPFITSDYERLSENDPDIPRRYSYSGAANTPRPASTLKPRYFYIACGKPHSKKDIYKISIKWVKNQFYDKQEPMRSIKQMTEIGENYIRYDSEFDPGKTVVSYGDKFRGTMLPKRSIFGWVCSFTTYKSKTGTSAEFSVVNDNKLNRDYRAVLICEYIKSVDDLKHDTIPAMSRSAIAIYENSMQVIKNRDNVSSGTNRRILRSSDGVITSIQQGPLQPTLYSIPGDRGNRKLIQSLTPEAQNGVTDIWGRALCWDENGSIVYSVQSNTDTYSCLRKPSNKLIYLKMGTLISPIVNVSLDQLVGISAFPDAKCIVIANNQQIELRDVTNLVLGSGFPCDENGNALYDDSRQIDLSLYTPNPL